MQQSAGYGEILRIPAFVVFWVGRIVSGLGDVLFTMSTTWYVLSETHSPLATAIVPLIPMLSFTVLSVPLATLADRLPKKTVLISSDLFRAVVVAAVWILMLLHRTNSVEIYAANLLLAMAGFLFGPAEQAALPRILPNADRQLAPANALLTSTSQLISLFGYAIGGALVAWLHTSNAVLINGLSYVVSALTFIPLTIPALCATASSGFRGFVSDSMAGIRFIWDKKIFRVLIGFGALINMVAAPMAVFTSVFSKDVLHAGIAGYGYLETASALGGVVGALIAGKISHRLRLWQWTFICLLLPGLCVAAMPMLPHISISIVLIMAMSGLLALLNIPMISSIQLLVPDELRGRAMNSFGLLISGVTSPIGLVVGGWIMGATGPKPVFIGIGILWAMSAIASLFIRSLRAENELEVGYQANGSRASNASATPVPDTMG